MERVILRGADDLAAYAADLIIDQADAAIEARGEFTLVLAGGSTPEKTYALLAEPERQEQIDWAKVSLFFGDERFVRPDDKRSNYGMAKQTLIDQVPMASDRVYPIPTDATSVEEAAEAYEAMLRHRFPEGTIADPPRFDLILLGLGDDGHTASLFPGSASLAVTDRWLVGSPPGVLPPPVDRITFTFPLLNAARKIVFLVAGANKAGVVQEVLDGNSAIDKHPAVGIQPVDGTLIWLLDDAAAAQLDK